ncbi:hypothetical protein OOK39_11990 [Streptomyces sp. NBC_00264]|uniref:hypothetical protein n=1 Tax=unclassified Streptomyces TaxID=2593676 RepID=UPI00225B184A|nr:MULTISPECIES: hypothetical protein [unclassified Streptomyces]MCX5159994.1 hypothetical protein [Streptomyces sp. NBC_00305]MCX5218517.1 hypothetical protein [Streptomyces sp. NBC_00264]
MSSRRGRKLKWRLQELAANLQITTMLVPVKQAEIDQLHAFRVLAHSEVQAYLEEITEQVLTVTEDRALNGGVLTHAGHHLLVSSSLIPLGNKAQAVNSKFPFYDPMAAQRSVIADSSQLTAAIKRHRKVIKDNGGVKAGNVRMLLSPLGYRDYCFAINLMDKLNEFGRERGNVAHGAGAAVANIPTGSTELNRITEILPGLIRLDQYVPRLLLPVT